MKKILITGMNKAQCTRKFYLNQQLKIIPSHYSLLNCLHDMGFTVDQREVTIGEDLSMYDDVIVFLAGPRQLVTTKLYNGLWAIAQRPDCILALDDWQVPDLFKGVTKLQDEKELLAPFILDTNKTTMADLKSFLPELKRAVETVCQMKNRMLISAFSTAHLQQDEHPMSLLFQSTPYPTTRIFTYNPNPYHRNRKPGDVGHEGLEDPFFVPSLLAEDERPRPQKERRFNFASLVQSRTKKWLKSQGVNIKNLDNEVGKIGHWQVDLYGSKADSQKRLTEDQMCNIFDRDWACLMPGYEHAGSGWWRARIQQCADAGSILIGDKKEMMIYYNDEFLAGIKASDIIQLTDEELVTIANAQRDALIKWHPLDKSTQRKELQNVIDAIKII